MTSKAKQRPHYVDNKKFSLAVVEYVETINEAREADSEIPKVTDYIATCFMKISEGLSHRPNFVRYTYREEMVMDGVENCLRAINNYKIETATRTVNPTAFSYFTQICFFAFIRRITKEKKQQEIKFRFIEKMGNGVPILDTVTRKCVVEKINSTTFKIILTQGLNRQIRRMCEYLGYEVTTLKRIRIINIALDIPVGRYRDLTQSEIKELNMLIEPSS